MLSAWTPLQAQIVRDGTVGPPGGPLQGPAYDITADLGQQTGNNLFHSFSQFNINKGEEATFFGPPEIANVLARVTGRTPSNIDGILRTSGMPNANFFLLNPAGVLLGPDAQLEVAGSFAVTTADEIRLADGGRFSATDPAGSVLTSAPPSAFGFLGPSPAAVEVNARMLAVPAGEVLSVVGGDVRIVGGQLLAPDGRINLVSAASGEVAFDATDPGAPVDAGSLAARGDIQMSGGEVRVDGAGGGSIVVRADDASIDGGAAMLAVNDDVGGGGIDVELTGGLKIDAVGSISVLASGQARGGDLRVEAERLELTGSPRGMVFIASLAQGAGDGGNITLDVASDLTLLAGGVVTSINQGSGTGGRLEVTAGTILLRDQNTLMSSTAFSDLGNIGRGGDITIGAGTVAVENNASIFARADSLTTGGRVSVTASEVRLSGDFSSIFGSDAGSLGDGGGVDVTAGMLLIEDSAFITTESLNADFNGSAITINGGTVHFRTGGGIASRTSTAGDAGPIAITAETIVLEGQETGITASSLGAGDAGPITITADSITVSDFAAITTSTAFGTGQGGTINLTAGEVNIINGGFVAAAALGEGNGGAIEINGGTLRIAGDGAGILVSSIPQQQGSGESAGDAGDVRIAVDNLMITADGSVNASTLTGGDGGDITIQAGTVILDRGADPESGGGTILAQTLSTEPGAGDAGNVTINAGSVELRGSAVSVLSQGDGRGGSLTINADTLEVADGSGVFSLSVGTGDAGTIVLRAARQIRISGSGINSAATRANAGDVTIDGGRILDILESEVSAEAVVDGGNIKLAAIERVRISGSTITGRAGRDGGQIAIDPQVVILEKSLIDGRAAGVPVQVQIDPEALFLRTESDILTTSQSVPPELDIAGSLVVLPVTLVSAQSQLLELCAVRPEGEVSSFTVVGQGGLPLQGGGWLPGFELSVPPAPPPAPAPPPEERRGG
jgi:filamentous hemagglutinin family protein